eukprot:TRINITY_DN10566_c0_g1_i8.p1 TRINITY_DN10566_c0_g1~~TRINITY_DN10566_c0_g1_i8.p1  ORF type:complete len:273 (+),score=80.60 TRINITY_DN10566_c0_g1_i8:45-821(+)
MLRSLVGSEMCIRDRYQRRVRGTLLGACMEVEQLLEQVEIRPGTVVLSSLTEPPTGGQVLLIVPGSGSQEPGYWSSAALCHEHGEEVGTPLLLVQAALERGWGVLCASPNLNHHPDGRPIVGSESPDQHVVSVWEWLSGADELAVAAHSQGAASVFALIERHGADVFERVRGIAMADSVHRQLPTHLPEPLLQMVSRSVVNWVSSSQPLDSLNPKPWIKGFAGGVQCRSAGASKHELTPHSATSSMIQFLDHCMTEFE